uniref:Uncharacterized protein n=1 Tax=Rhizophora mucronata TaxID=61149 RepID=A0A2P2N878_RHIMU
MPGTLSPASRSCEWMYMICMAVLLVKKATHWKMLIF